MMRRLVCAVALVASLGACALQADQTACRAGDQYACISAQQRIQQFQASMGGLSASGALMNQSGPRAYAQPYTGTSCVQQGAFINCFPH